jgi:hypothetical protein
MRKHTRFVAYLSVILISLTSSTYACLVSPKAITWLPEPEIQVGLFSDSTVAGAVIAFQLPQSANVNLKVYDQTGGLVATLMEGWHSAGWHLVNFNLTSLSPGIYQYTLSAGGLSASGRLAPVK